VSLSDTLLSGQLLFATLVIGAIYALVALGLNLVYGTCDCSTSRTAIS
jgi:branched-chain amino acid transport system permease protein